MLSKSGLQVLILRKLIDVSPVFQTDQMSPQMVEERMEGADPCHDYNEEGPGPEGCW